MGSISQDEIKAILQKANRALSIREISSATGLHKRTVGQQIDLMVKWREIEISLSKINKAKLIQLKEVEK